jgi:hypothetical protein
VRSFLTSTSLVLLISGGQTDWYGNSGRGSWRISRPVQTAKNSINISIEYVPPAISNSVWSALLREQETEEASKSGRSFVVLDRSGQTWTGEVAESMAAAEKEREDSVVPGEKERTGHKKAKPSSVSTSWSATNDNPSPTGSCTQSPDQHSFSQLTPPNSEASLSALLPVPEAENAWPPALEDMPESRPSFSRKRTPSEPGPNMTGRLNNGRSRSATIALNGGVQQQQQQHHYQASSGSTTSGAPRSPAQGSRGSPFRSGRGRGASSGKGDKPQNGMPSIPRAGGAGTAPIRGRGGRRGNQVSSTSTTTRGGRTALHSQ